MARTADITTYDEIRSLQMYVKLEFPTDKIRLERPQEDEDYDILIEPPNEIINDARGTYLSDRIMPLTVQRWCVSYLAAVDAVEKLERLFTRGRGVGKNRRIPVWKHARPGESGVPQPNPNSTVPDRFLNIQDLSTRVLPSQTIGQYVAICDLRVRGWRITHEFTDQLINEVVQVTEIAD